MVTRIVRTAAAQAAEPLARRAVKSARRIAGGVLGLAGERMSKVDTAWLRMDCDHNLMMILGVWTLRPRVEYEALCRRVEERLLKIPRFRQRVVEDAAGATWIEVPGIEAQQLVVREKLPRTRKGGEQQALQARVGQLAMEPLDRKLPLWRMHLVEDYDGGSALVVRIHHCIADGIALIAVVMSLVDGGAAPPERKPRDSAQGAEDWIADTLVRPFTDLTIKALGAAGEGAAQSLHLLRDPQSGLDGSAELARLAYRVLSDAAALALMPDDSKTSLKGLPAGRKRVAWCDPLPLDEVKAVGKALNCSINDVLLSCVSGAIGEYLRLQGEEVTGCEIRAMVPVNLRPTEHAWKLGNRFGLAPLVLPIGVENPIERVYEVRSRMNALKGSTQPLLAFGVLTLAGLLVKPAQDAILALFSNKTTAVMTNVPGPRDRLRLLGAELEQCMFWVPQSGNIGLGVSILSYGGNVQFGVITDAALCPHPQKIIDAFAPEFDRLSWLTLMLPCGEG